MKHPLGPSIVALGTLALLLGTSSPAAAQSTEGKKSEKPSGFVMEERPSLRFGDTLRVDLTSTFDFYWRGYDEGSDDAEFGRRRVGFDGRLFDILAFEVERDLGDASNPWRDVLVEFRKYRALRVRAGHFKIPFGIERLTPIRQLEFAQRSVVTETLTPGRDTGVQLSGRVLGDALSYTVGTFRHDGSTPPRNDDDAWTGGHTWAARLVVQPFAASRSRILRKIETGAGYTRGDLTEGLNSPVLRTISGYEAFAPVYVSGHRRRAGADASLAHGPFVVRGEFIRSIDDRRGQGLMADDLPELVANGWQLSGSWFAVGDLKNGGTTPRRPLFAGGIGAIQLAGRVESLGFSSDAPWDETFRNPRAANILPNDYHAWTAGLNWFPVRYVKLQLNVVRERLGDPERRPSAARPWSTSRVFRVQFSL